MPSAKPKKSSKAASRRRRSSGGDQWIIYTVLAGIVPLLIGVGFFVYKHVTHDAKAEEAFVHPAPSTAAAPTPVSAADETAAAPPDAPTQGGAPMLLSKKDTEKGMLADITKELAEAQADAREKGIVLSDINEAMAYAFRRRQERARKIVEAVAPELAKPAEGAAPANPDAQPTTPAQVVAEADDMFARISKLPPERQVEVFSALLKEFRAKDGRLPPSFPAGVDPDHLKVEDLPKIQEMVDKMRLMMAAGAKLGAPPAPPAGGQAPPPGLPAPPGAPPAPPGAPAPTEPGK